MEEQTLTGFNFEKLGLDNYIDWKFPMQKYVTGKDLWEIVNGTEVVANDTSEDQKLKVKETSKCTLFPRIDVHLLL